MKLKSRKDYLRRRHMRGRRKISGNSKRLRMSIAMSNKHIYVQFIDDDDGQTLVSVSTLGNNKEGNNIASAKLLGRHAAEVALKKDITNVVIDRGGHKFHGRVKAIVDAAIEAGLVVGRCSGGSPPAPPGEEGGRAGQSRTEKMG